MMTDVYRATVVSLRRQGKREDMRRSGVYGRADLLTRALQRTACIGVGLVALALPVAAAATPTVIATGRAVRLPGFPHTGNILGAGAAVEAEVKISGTEYFGSPPPLIGISVYLPTGVVIDTHDFPTCPAEIIIEEREPRMCPKGSSAGPNGKAFGIVSLGGERVAETAEIFSFLAPGGGLEFLVVGHTPVSLEVPGTAQLIRSGAMPGFGPEFTGAVPLVVTVPGAPDASVEKINITLGAAIRKHGKTFYYGRVPKRCPSGGFRVRSEFMFGEPEDLAKPETVVVPFRAPCPPK
jgi:hypothetical protein